MKQFLKSFNLISFLLQSITDLNYEKDKTTIALLSVHASSHGPETVLGIYDFKQGGGGHTNILLLEKSAIFQLNGGC